MDPKSDLHRYLQAAREDLLWKLEGLSEYDVRRPLTPTGTNLLGLVKHLAVVEFLYFGLVFDRTVEDPPEYLLSQDGEVNGDFWATADETRDDILDLYRRAAVHADATIEALDLDTVGFVPWFSPSMQRLSLHAVLVHVVAECHRHVGHADIVRELIDGTAGLSRDEPFLPSDDPAWWDEYRARVSDAAEVSGAVATRAGGTAAAQASGAAQVVDA
ncbi:DinB family protein [Kribbella qitaiheensis]|uniref:DinB family protein n=1 Tax=Kribbella qitaiheensis TaxID=1544730 RepID=UPI0036162EBD